MPFMTLEMSENFRTVDNIQVLAKHYNGPLLVIGAEKDEQVSAALSKKLYAASQSSVKELVIVANANHVTMLDDANTMNVYKTFVNKL